MIVVGAATSILSVCAIPAFADSDTREATADTLGALAYDAPGLVEPGASETGSRLLGDEARSTGDRSAVAGYGDDNAGDGAEGRTSHTPARTEARRASVPTSCGRSAGTWTTCAAWSAE